MNKISLFFLLLATFCLQLRGQNTTLFSDNFETANTWTIFEEIVSGNACYGDNIGEVARSTDFAKNGANALRVWSNRMGSTKSNHVIAAHHISNTQGITGQLRYGIWAYMETNIGLTQSGPEFSLQSTRTVGVQNLTYIAGIQYIGNQWVADKWNIWHNGTWQTIKASEFNSTLSPNTWYYLELAFDMTNNSYTSLTIQGGSVNTTLDLTQSFQNAPLGFQIGGETRGWTPSYFVTAESENLWTTCSQIRENKVYYDDLLLQSEVVLPIELTRFEAQNTEGGNHLTWETANAINNKGFQVERKKARGNDWDILGFINSNPKPAKSIFSSYDFWDNAPLSIAHYRLRLIDKEGKTYFSKTISVATKTTKLKVYPSVTKDFLNIETTKTADFQIFNLLGQLVLQGQVTQRLDVSMLPQGTYIFKLGTEQTKFVKK